LVKSTDERSSRTDVDGYGGLLNRHEPLASIWLQSVAPRQRGAKPDGLVEDKKGGASSRSKIPIAMGPAQNKHVSKCLRKEGIE
jgi:hypothetical protein